MKIYIGADHRGFALKEKIKVWLANWNYQSEDVGAFEHNESDDYPDFAELVAKKVAADAGSKGILLCGSDIGVTIAANKIKGIRAGGATIAEQIQAAVYDDDINVLTIGADYLNEEQAKEIVKIFLEAKFSNGRRFVRRIEKINNLEKNS
jgi:ribose 5-phosphate isomerase B